MMNKRIYKSLSGIGLAVLLSGAMALIGCSEEKREEKNESHGFFKISVKTEDLGTEETRAVEETEADTIITSLNGDCYIETIYSSEKMQAGVTRSTTSLASGTEVVVLVYGNDEYCSYIGQLKGTIGSDGSVTTPDGQLYLAPGTYNFVCLINAKIYPADNFYKIEKGKNCMSAVIREQVIRPEDEDCVLDFLVKHDTAQIKIKLHAANGLMKNISASLVSEYSTCPVSNPVNIPWMTSDNKSYTHGVLSDKYFDKAGGNDGAVDLSSNQEFYYIGDYDYTDIIILHFSGGDVDFNFGNVYSVMGKDVPLNLTTLRKNRIMNVRINFRKRETGYSFSMGGGTSTDTLPYDSRGLRRIIDSEHHDIPVGWTVTRVSTVPPEEYTSDKFDAMSEGIVTDVSPMTINPSKKSNNLDIALTQNPTAVPRDIYVRVTQNLSNDVQDLHITQEGNPTLYEVVFNSTAGGKVTNHKSNWLGVGQSVISEAFPNPGATFLGWYTDAGNSLDTDSRVHVEGNKITVTPSNDLGRYLAKFRYDAYTELPSYILGTVVYSDPTPAGTMTMEDACKLLLTPDAVLFDKDLCQHNFVGFGVSTRGWWVLKRAYWNPTIKKDPTTYIPKVRPVTHEEALSGKYYFVPSMDWDAPLHNNHPSSSFSLAGQGHLTAGDDFTINGIPVTVPKDRNSPRMHIVFIMNDNALNGRDSDDQGFVRLTRSGPVADDATMQVRAILVQ